MQFLASNTVDNLLRGLWASLCQLIYRILAWLYELFMNISRVEILTTDNIEPIYQRVTMILTIIMVFYVTFEAVKYVVQPDNFTDKEKGGGKLTLKMILVVILIAFVPSFFTWAYKFQNVIFDNQVFSKIILGKQSVDTDKFGRIFSANILGMFYYADEATWSQDELEKKNNCDDIPCKTVVNANLSNLVDYGELPLMQVGLTDGDKVEEEGTGKVFKYYIHFDGLFAVLVGAFICYILILYCIDVGVRVIQLTFLQIVAPIPIIGYLSPKKDGIFQKWVKQCTTTYLDLFIRTGIIYFGLLICQILSEAFASETLFNNIPGDTTTTMKVFIYIALILAMLMFMQRAPKMLGELFPKGGAASGNFGLSLKDRPALARGAGMAIGGALSGAKGLIGGTINRAKRDIRNLRTGRHRDDLKDYGKNTKDLWSKRLDRGKAQLDYLKNRSSMTVDQRNDAKKALREKKQDVTNAKIAQKSARASLQNSALGIAPLSGAASGVGGLYRGATIGAKATDFKGVISQTKEGLKQTDSALQKTEKWYAEGGGSQVSRVATSIQKGLGISTASDGITDQIKRYDDQIKANEALISTESDVKKTTDDSKDRSGSKLEKKEQNTIIEPTDSIQYKDIDGNIQTVSGTAGKTTSQVYEQFEKEANDAQSAADAASKAAQEDPGNATKAAAAKAAQDRAATAKRNQAQVKKSLEEYAITKILRDNDPRNNKEHDQVLVDKIATVKKSVEISKRNRATVEAMKEQLGATSPLYQAYITGNITTFKELDDIQAALITIANERTRTNTSLKDTKTRIETSARTSAAKADVSASGK